MCSVCTDENRRGKNAEDKVQVKVIADVMLDCVKSFCYLGDVIGATDGAEEACRNKTKNARMSFTKLGSILTTRSVSPRLKGKFYRMCAQRVMVHCSVT